MQQHWYYLFTWKMLNTLTNFLYTWDAKLRIQAGSVPELTIYSQWLIKKYWLSRQNTGRKGVCVCLCVCLSAAEYFSWDIFDIPLAFCIYHLSSECDCQSCCRQAAWQHNRAIQHVENPSLHVQLVLVFLFLSHCGATTSSGSHTTGGSEVWSGRVSLLLEPSHLCCNLCEINKLSVGLNCFLVQNQERETASPFCSFCFYPLSVLHLVVHFPYPCSGQVISDTREAKWEQTLLWDLLHLLLLIKPEK